MSGPSIPASYGPRQAQPLDALMRDARDVVDGIFGKVNSKDLPIGAQIAIERRARVTALAARILGGDEGRELLEAMADASVRRPHTIIAPGISTEFAALYAAKREGQDEMLYLLLSWIAEGRGEAAPTRET